MKYIKLSSVATDILLCESKVSELKCHSMYVGNKYFGEVVMSLRDALICPHQEIIII